MTQVSCTRGIFHRTFQNMFTVSRLIERTQIGTVRRETHVRLGNARVNFEYCTKKHNSFARLTIASNNENTFCEHFWKIAFESQIQSWMTLNWAIAKWFPIIPAQNRARILLLIPVCTFRLCFLRSKILFDSSILKCSVIFIPIGAARSTLQDIKVIEKAGGFCYSDFTNDSKRNRFIYWWVELEWMSSYSCNDK